MASIGSRPPVPLLCAITLSLCSILVAGQAPASGTLSEAVRGRLRNGRFDVITSVRGLPLGVRDVMQKLFGGTLDIAEPGGEFQMAGRAANPQLPLRRMVAAACSTDFYCLVYYERGGTARSWRVALFRWTPDATRFEWGGTAPESLKTVDDVRKAILSGAVKPETGSW